MCRPWLYAMLMQLAGSLGGPLLRTVVRRRHLAAAAIRSLGTNYKLDATGVSPPTSHERCGTSRPSFFGFFGATTHCRSRRATHLRGDASAVNRGDVGVVVASCADEGKKKKGKEKRKEKKKKKKNSTFHRCPPCSACCTAGEYLSHALPLGITGSPWWKPS
ncbi:hypothetical protein LY78DRAFT_275940 [Colletotrichum sublineola]|nr:hypothetical protein LY78DRAFT_275940 [Colletotrichum sublineola]